jgi:protein-disulfide isomerase
LNNRFLWIIVAGIALFGGLVFINKKDAKTTSTSNVSPSSHIVGAGNKKVTLIEYGDFECPACGQYFPIIQELKKKYGDDITFQFRHFPLVNIHPNAMAAHRAAEAAGKQGRFFEMHDALYLQQQNWKSSTSPASIFEGYAQQLKLDMDNYRLDVASAETNAVINADIEEGKKAGANGTPTFVLNGKRLEENPRGVEDFSKLIDEAATTDPNSPPADL